MLQMKWIGFFVLLIHGFASAGTTNQNCRLLEPKVHTLLLQNNSKDEVAIRDGGIGGTGIIAEITSTSPLRLAGCNIEVTSTTAIFDEQIPMGVDKLARGQVVHAKLNIKDGRFQASSIIVQHLLEGVVAMSSANNELEVLGKSVLVVPGKTQMPSALLRSLLGSNVKVSGFRLPDGTVIASRIDTYKDLETAGTTGRLERSGNIYTVGGIEVEGMPDPKWLGDIVSVLGYWSGNKIQATQFDFANFQKGEATPRWMFQEGRLRQSSLGQIGFVDGPNFSDQENQFIEGLRVSPGDAVSVFGALLPDGRIKVYQLWRN